MTVVVENYGDLISDEFLNVERADAVARELANGHEFVARVPDWMVAEKAIAPSTFGAEIVAGSIKRESEKAYLVECGGAEAWLPKSTIRVYEAAEDADLAALETSGRTEGTA